MTHLLITRAREWRRKRSRAYWQLFLLLLAHEIHLQQQDTHPQAVGKVA